MNLKDYLYKCPFCRNILFHVVDTRRICYENALVPRKLSGGAP